MFEQTAVFERGIGEVTDVVEKELFRIAPRTEEAESWALRPEPTAGIVRAYVQHGMQTLPQPVKLTTTGPMFRYDRPQAGRYRQFWQFDVEAIGDPGPAIDAEIIELGHRFYAEVGVDRASRSRSTPSATRTAGPPTSRSSPPTTGVTPRTLPATERDRLERNALRLLDSKDPAMAELNAAAPRITDRLCEACAAHFEAVKAHLTRSACRGASSPGSSAASTTTRGRRSSTTSPGARASSRRSVAGAATTAAATQRLLLALAPRRRTRTRSACSSRGRGRGRARRAGSRRPTSGGP